MTKKEIKKQVTRIAALGALLAIVKGGVELTPRVQFAYDRNTFQTGQTYNVEASKPIGIDNLYTGGVSGIRRQLCTLEQGGKAKVIATDSGSMRRFVYNRPVGSTRVDTCPTGQQFTVPTDAASQFLR
jgi:hypothetical protein